MAKGGAHSVRYGAAEEAEVAEYVKRTGESESAVLARTSLRGIRGEKLDRAISSYLNHRDLVAGSEEAGLSRAVFIRELISRGVVIFDHEPARFRHDLTRLAERTGNKVLGDAVRAAEAATPLS